LAIQVAKRGYADPTSTTVRDVAVEFGAWIGQRGDWLDGAVAFEGRVQSIISDDDESASAEQHIAEVGKALAAPVERLVRRAPRVPGAPALDLGRRLDALRDMEASMAALTNSHDTAITQRDALHAQIESMVNSRGWRALEALRRLKRVGRA
jgi:hypothetical protein